MRILEFFGYGWVAYIIHKFCGEVTMYDFGSILYIANMVAWGFMALPGLILGINMYQEIEKEN